MAESGSEIQTSPVSKPVLKKLSVEPAPSSESRKSPPAEQNDKQLSPTHSIFYTPRRSSSDFSTSDSSVTSPTIIEDSLLGEHKTYLFKVLVIGNVNSGKTSLIKRYIYNCFPEYYCATVGVDYSLKIVNLDLYKTVALQLWDIGGEERIGQLTRPYYREAAGAIILYDVTNPKSFAAVTRWKRELDSKSFLRDGSPVPCILVGNKCDEMKKINENVTKEEYCKRLGFLGWFETSAKEDINVNAPFETLIQKMLNIQELLDFQNDPETFKLKQYGDGSKKCSC